MAQRRGNQYRGKKKKSKKGKNPFAGIIAFFKNEQFHKVVGASFLLIAAYLFIAFTSFLFTWQVDQDKVLGSWSQLLLSEDAVDNWLGKIGAITAHQFMHVWFGIAAYIFVLLFFVSGFRILFQVALLPLKKTFKYSFFALIWLSVTLGYFFDTNFFYLGGGIGYSMSNFLNSVVGSIGSILLILFSLLVFSIYTFNISFDWFKKLPDMLNKDEEADGFDVVEENQIIEAEPEPVAVDMEVQEEESPVEEVPEKSVAEAEELTPEIEEVAPIEEETAAEEVIDENFSVEKAESQEEELTQEEIDEVEKLQAEDYDPTLDLSDYQHPHIDLLEQHGSNEINVDKDELTENKNRIVETLANYNIQIDKIKATIGPTVTLYELIPAAGVRISKIKNLEDDIALSLSALGIRIIAPIPGKGTIGIEVPNLNPEIVSMRSIIASDRFQNASMELPVGLGKTISNETFVADLAKMPHLLMAGATGQGKSVGLNAILTSLVYKKHPSQLKLVLVDPKKVELTLFNKIERHFLAKLPDSEDAIITDTKKVVHTLNSLCIEMDNRYDLLKEAQVRNIKEYNAKFIARKLNPNKGHKFLPYIVLVVDEFADLIMTAGKEVEAPIARLAQLARAIGIHLIIATQRPSVNIITGTIKANFPARIAFRVTSKIDSRTILDAGGADQLIGRGDMLLSTGSDLIRVQCAFVDTPEVEEITTFIGDQRGYPETYALPEYVDESASGGGDISADDRDALFEEAARIIVQHQQGSASLLQRRLKLGYNRAGRIIDQLEHAGIIGPFEGSKARQVLIKDPASLEQFLNDLE